MHVHRGVFCIKSKKVLQPILQQLARNWEREKLSSINQGVQGGSGSFFGSCEVAGKGVQGEIKQSNTMGNGHTAKIFLLEESRRRSQMCIWNERVRGSGGQGLVKSPGRHPHLCPGLVCSCLDSDSHGKPTRLRGQQYSLFCG